MKDNGFACPICAEPTGVAVVTVDCDADHALCPGCAEKWFSNCSRCHMCNASIDSINVHLLSSVVEEGDPLDMARTITERSLHTAVFSVIAQTKLKPDELNEEEIRAWLPTDLCQVCNTDSGRNPLRCGSCGDPYHLRCTGLRRRPRSEWCCPACDSVDVAAPVAEIVETGRHETQELSHSSGNDAAGRTTRSRSVATQVREAESLALPTPAAVPQLQLSGAQSPSAHHIDMGPPGGMKQTRECRSSDPAIQMGALSENRMQCAVNCLLALQHRPAGVEPSKQRRPRMRNRSCFLLSTANRPQKCLDGAGSSRSGRTPPALHQGTGASSCHAPDAQATRPDIHRVRARACRHAVHTSAAAAGQPRPFSSRAEGGVVTAHPSPQTCALPAQGRWLPQANPFKRKIFVPHSGTSNSPNGSQTSATSQQVVIATSEQARSQPELHSSLLLTPTDSNSPPAARAAYAQPSASTQLHTGSHEGGLACPSVVDSRLAHRNVYKRKALAQDIDDEVAPHSKLVRMQPSSTAHQSRHQASRHPSQRSGIRAPMPYVTVPRRNHLIVQEYMPQWTAATASKKVATFSKKLMHKAFNHYAFQDAVPASELNASADHAAELLSTNITNAMHPLEHGDADGFVEGVIDQYGILFANEKAHNGVVKYVRNELLKFSRSALAP